MGLFDFSRQESGQPERNLENFSFTSRPDSNGNANEETGKSGTSPDTNAGATAPGTDARTETGKTEKPISETLGTPVIPSIDIPVPETRTRKPRKKKSADGDDLGTLTTNISALTIAAYAMSAKLMNADIFQITQEEADSIAAPAARIFDRMNMSAQMNKYGDAAALIAAVSVITIPRIMIYIENKPKKEVRKRDRKTTTNEGNIVTISKPDNPVTPADDGTNDKAYFDLGII